MSAKRDRPRSVPAHKIPTCAGYTWTRRPPESEVDKALAYLVKHGCQPPAGEVDRGEGHGCDVTAAFLVTYQDTGRGPRTEGACPAHVDQLVGWGERYRDSQARWFYNRDVPAPKVTRLEITPDSHAAAYGRTRYILTQRPTDGAVQPALMAAPSRLPSVPPRRQREPRRDGVTTETERPVQGTLF